MSHKYSLVGQDDVPDLIEQDGMSQTNLNFNSVRH